MIEYAVKVLEKRTSEADILTVVDQSNICNWKNYDGSKVPIDLKGLSPKIIADPCEAILASYEDELIEVLTTRFDIRELPESIREMYEKNTPEDLVKFEAAGKFCNNNDSLTRACFGIRAETDGDGGDDADMAEQFGMPQMNMPPRNDAAGDGNENDEYIDDGVDIEDMFNEEL